MAVIDKLKIAEQVSNELAKDGIDIGVDVIEYIDMFIVNEIRTKIDENKEVYIPYFGRLQPNKEHIKKLVKLGIYKDDKGVKSKKKIGLKHTKTKRNKLAVATLDFKVKSS